MYVPEITANQHQLLMDALSFYVATNHRLNALQAQELRRYLNSDDIIMYPDVEHAVKYYRDVVEVSATEYNDPDAKNDLKTIDEIISIIPSIDRSFDKGTDFEKEL